VRLNLEHTHNVQHLCTTSDGRSLQEASNCQRHAGMGTSLGSGQRAYAAIYIPSSLRCRCRSVSILHMHEACLLEDRPLLPCGNRCNRQVAKWLAIDSRAVVLHAPRLLQAACAALTDVYVYLLARQRFSPPAAGWVRVQ
jgi:hypothetical protein